MRNGGSQGHLAGETVGTHRARNGSQAAHRKASRRIVLTRDEGNLQGRFASEARAHRRVGNGFRVGMGAGMTKQMSRELTRQQYLDLYYYMRLNRAVEDTMV